MTVAAVVDSYPVFLNGLCDILQHNFEDLQIIRSPNLSELYEKTTNIDPDFIILGVNKLFGTLELEMFEKIRQSSPITATIVFFDEINMVFPFLLTGANGYVAKKSNPDELIACIRCVMNNENYLDAQILDLIFTPNR